MKDLTVLYYTANTEDEKFEANIKANILKNKGDLPLVSVSQKPLTNFGENYCVGIHEACYANEFRQIQIGLKAVKTTYVLVAEADCLYPPEYFNFQPTNGVCYRYGNVWVIYSLDNKNKKALAYYKQYSDGAQIIRKSDWEDWINEKIGQEEIWYKKSDQIGRLNVIKTDPLNTWTSENPVITFKTRLGVSKYTTIKKEIKPVTTLPFWGDINDLKRGLFL